MSRIYWDTMLFVYLLEKNAEYEGRVRQLFVRMTKRRDRLLTSTLTLGELLVAPLKTGDLHHADAVRNFLQGPDVDLLPIDAHAVENYAAIRATTEARPADAIHLACAAGSKTDVFITNDRRLHGLVVPGIQFIVGIDLAVNLLGIE